MRRTSRKRVLTQKDAVARLPDVIRSGYTTFSAIEDRKLTTGPSSRTIKRSRSAAIRRLLNLAMQRRKDYHRSRAPSRCLVARKMTHSHGVDLERPCRLQIRAARAVLGWSAEDLAREASSVGVRTIRRAELADVDGANMTVANEHAIRRALEAAGVEFIDQNGGGPGVRLRMPPTKKELAEKPSASAVCYCCLWRLNQNGVRLTVARLRISSESAASASIKSNMVDLP